MSGVECTMGRMVKIVEPIESHVADIKIAAETVSTVRNGGRFLKWIGAAVGGLVAAFGGWKLLFLRVG